MQLLGLKGREYYFDSQISAAYEELLSTPLETGYSKQVQEGKDFLLQQALDELQQTKGRSAPDSPGLCLEWGLLPSALALLQQVRQHWSFDLAIKQNESKDLGWEFKRRATAVWRRSIRKIEKEECGNRGEQEDGDKFVV